MAIPAAATPSARRDDFLAFEIDLTQHELLRRAHVVAASPDLDPVALLDEENQARRMLMSNLNPEQEATLAMLRDAGVLP
jgi:hypothetical protein